MRMTLAFSSMLGGADLESFFYECHLRGRTGETQGLMNLRCKQLVHVGGGPPFYRCEAGVPQPTRFEESRP